MIEPEGQFGALMQTSLNIVHAPSLDVSAEHGVKPSGQEEGVFATFAHDIAPLMVIAGPAVVFKKHLPGGSNENAEHNGVEIHCDKQD
jgi:hypothetical protein